MKAALAGIALCLGSWAANAALVEFNFTADLKSPLQAGVGPWLGDLNAGTTGTGSFVLDTSIPNAAANSLIGQYPGSLVSGTFTVGGMTFTSSGDVSVIWVEASTTFVQLGSSAGSATGIDPAWSFSRWMMQLTAPDTNSLSSNAVPDYLDLPFYPTRAFTLGASNAGQELTANFEVTSIEKVVANDVPEPASFALVGVGLLGITALRKRQAR